MDFHPDENQAAVAGLAADVLTRSTEQGDWRATWTDLARADLLGLHAPESVGGAGLGAEEMTAVLTEAGRLHCTAPLLPALALGIAPVAAHGTTEQQQRLLPAALSGEQLIVGALNEAGAALPRHPRTRAERTADGWSLTGRKVAVGYAQHAAHLLVSASTDAGAAIFVVDSGAPGLTVLPSPSSSAAPEATVVLDAVELPPDAVLGSGVDGTVARSVREYGLVGAAALADGALAGALALTVDHLRKREQFGRPLAAFQAVAQQIADVYIASRTLHLAATSAAWRVGTGSAADEATALAAYWLAAEAPSAARTCHHLHGGIGVDATYPLHRFSSALKDLVRFVGGATATLRDLTIADHDDAVGTAGEGRFIALTHEQRALQAELRDYFSTLMSSDERTAMLVQRHGEVFRNVVRRMGLDGRLGVGWPTEYGGRGFGPIEQYLFVNEATRADVQLPSVTLQTVGPTLQAFGTEEQKAKFLPKILSGEVHFAIGYTEPEAGTDLASLRTTAVRDGDHYVVNGQKIFTTGGHDADYVWLAVRTDPDAPKHKGISILILDTSDPGYTWTPIITADGAHHVNATYYNDVRVPAEMLVGVENEGWKLITTQLNHERVMLGPSGRIGSLYDRVADWATEHGVDTDPDVAAALAQVRAAELVNELLNWQVAAAEAGGPVDVADASATKVFGSDRIQALTALLEDVVGTHGDPGEAATGELLHWLDVQAKRNLVLTFGGGVNEIQRELIALMGLQLPRVPR
ncbi:Acyl-CoA dehydrogenase domain protein OS=Tsukamurella paurometabola (strain ATCC 8368 / DSM/ CCUG 35730 / CIP 100753 / JCM 10117 / KCTC 9821 / NBRC 16120/ NCIMB 702349 / NCTC 13040) OX=521096 GN=Tpau_3855 PE=3 SV=1 [Tsukamurella paurometabola]|uniref:Acyl-CoA dehydrogenase domain protein n=1 Tax=Tsukamurella paurometabola (strain ATCC 8368 / DSM 20162 / CCUG 35730 / CIP 100753 / JCM 10117 / KCTC 9821 / NBRC 16120 / NCIMB 702349 / NCTC 13040) TaxID=521096 RepID=D5UMF6_TSUPD|nr:acyl-CoA dehydrogenase [Tsukamurella paurometabola]ADG80430.1 acyl-CoA dehydrogenase domain protein [Tsukamurella paurometabola DSM 20162]SUP39610.1 Acyl-CoA dehydrogenase fadE12 [Tsukamurella paurometabola]